MTAEFLQKERQKIMIAQLAGERCRNLRVPDPHPTATVIPHQSQHYRSDCHNHYTTLYTSDCHQLIAWLYFFHISHYGFMKYKEQNEQYKFSAQGNYLVGNPKQSKEEQQPSANPKVQMNPCIFFCICLCCINKGALQV